MASSLFGDTPANVDVSLASLFSSSSRPAKRGANASATRSRGGETTSSAEPRGETNARPATAVLPIQTDKKSSRQHKPKVPILDDDESMVADVADERIKKRRKRKRDNDDLESSYLDKLSREEEKEEQQRQAERVSKKSKTDAIKPLAEDEDDSVVTETQGDSGSIVEDGDDDDDEEYVIPKHETANDAEPSDVERALRTIFLGNVSTLAITSKTSKRALLAHLSSFLADLPQAHLPHKIESMRFRSTAFSSAIPKKAAFARQDIMDATTKSTNAYVVYSTKQAAREAAKRLNGTIVLDRHLRVDEVAHPAKVDHHRCVFVGNLGFVDDETQMKAGDAALGHAPRKPQNGDVEEGLWRQFGKAGDVESVRVVRDPKTRVGKGFAYVQFKDVNVVEAALLFNEKRFPPLLPRKLRVVRAKKFKRNQAPLDHSSKASTRARPKSAPATGANGTDNSLGGRARKLLGRAGAATTGSKPHHKALRTPESFVFEGHRATKSQGNTGLKLGKGGKGKKKVGKPTNRGAKRGAAWKAKGSK